MHSSNPPLSKASIELKCLEQSATKGNLSLTRDKVHSRPRPLNSDLQFLQRTIVKPLICGEHSQTPTGAVSSNSSFHLSAHKNVPEFSDKAGVLNRHGYLTHTRNKVSEDVEECLEVIVLTPTFMATLWLKFPYVFRIGEHGSNGPSLLHEVCLERGWREYDELLQEFSPGVSRDVSSTIGWNFWWSHTNHSVRNLKSFSSWQLTNRTDRNFGFTCKDTCTRYIRRLKNTYGDIYDLCPLSFNVPSEYTKLCIVHTQRKSEAFWNFWDRAHYIGPPLHKVIDLEKQPIWICKPVGKSQGKGIMVFDTVTNLTYNTRSVVQEYMTRPHLIGNYKWDLRIYVVIVSTLPLVFYAYREGLVRFATNPFDLKNLGNQFAHLTNSSVNKQSPTYFKNKSGIGRGCKWSLRKLRRYFHDKEIWDWYLWQRISAILILTIIGDAVAIGNNFHHATKAKNFFLMGFDIMVDRDLRPFLVEVNSNPSLSNDCEVDRLVKKPMLHDLFDLLNLPNGRHFDTCLDSKSNVYKCPSTHPIGYRIASAESATDNSQSEPDTDNSTTENYSIDDSSDSEDHDNDPTFSSSINSLGLKSSAKLKARAPSSFNSSESIRSILYNSGPISRYKELLTLGIEDGNNENFGPNTLEVGTSKNFLTSISTRSQLKSRFNRLEYPIFVSLPIKKLNSRRITPHISSSQTGITLAVSNWATHAPPKIGNWIRIFPFNKVTQTSEFLKKPFDVKDTIRQVQELLKYADQLQRGQVTEDDALDKLLKQKLQLTTQVWHPLQVLRK